VISSIGFRHARLAQQIQMHDGASLGPPTQVRNAVCLPEENARPLEALREASA
jgi:hypothetical protein